MQYKINIQFTIITLISIILCTGITAYAFYSALQHEVFIDLGYYAEMLSGEDLQDDYNLNIPDEIRVTLIDKEGNAIYDTNADVSSLGNHIERPEVIDAYRYGTGQASRKSSTLGKTAYYYALRLDNGDVLRVSKEANSLTVVIMQIAPVLVVLLVLLTFVTISFSRFLTDSIVRPIRQIAANMDNVGDEEIYPELRPFVKKIRSQHEEILKDTDMRQEFTANVSHELKTPLTAISGYAELLENGMIPVDQVPTYARQIHKNSDRLLTLINDVIRLSELDAVKSDVSEVVNLTEIARQCLSTLEFKAGEQNVTLHLTATSEITADTDANGDARCLTVGDPHMFEELVYNLCDNAVRYNNPGGHVYVTLREKQDEVLLSVRDTGIGIPRGDQERIFERFYRVDKSRSKQTGGTGLGLAIVKHIVEHIGARIELESETGMGTEIRVHCRRA